mgnify:CR=1 FL=1
MTVVQDKNPDDVLFVPSVDIMKQSVVDTYGGAILGVIMTGMGSDGLAGMKMIRERGGVTFAQDEESCVVYGMPKVCVENGIIDAVVPLEEMAAQITACAG